VLAAVAPAVVGLPLSINLLNTSRLAPRKDYDKNILLAGRLQMGAGTALLIDETVMQAGQLVEAGIHNLQALKGLLESQKVSLNVSSMFPQCSLNVLSGKKFKSGLQTHKWYCVNGQSLLRR
jgi:hypothetical protein